MERPERERERKHARNISEENAKVPQCYVDAEVRI